MGLTADGLGHPFENHGLSALLHRLEGDRPCFFHKFPVETAIVPTHKVPSGTATKVNIRSATAVQSPHTGTTRMSSIMPHSDATLLLVASAHAEVKTGFRMPKETKLEASAQIARTSGIIANFPFDFLQLSSIVHNKLCIYVYTTRLSLTCLPAWHKLGWMGVENSGERVARTPSRS